MTPHAALEALRFVLGSKCGEHAAEALAAIKTAIDSVPGSGSDKATLECLADDLRALQAPRTGIDSELRRYAGELETIAGRMR